ncbi:MAG: 30S ribosomal protein S16 [Anaerolineae bacterium]|nr:30S ribosomal protein S16 [Anaerolineae bacterium]
MVRLRLRRVGRKKQASFRVVAADRETSRDGRFLEVVGFYNPRTDPSTITLKEDRIYEWLSKGAQPSDSTAQLFKTVGLYERYERFKKGEDVAKLVQEAEAAEAGRNVSGKTRREAPKGKPKKAEPKAEAAPAAEVKAEEPAAEEAPAEETKAEVVEEAAEAKAEEAPAAEEEKSEEAE